MMQTYSQSPAGRSGEALGLRFTANHLARVIGPLAFGLNRLGIRLVSGILDKCADDGCGGLISRRGARGQKGS